VEWGYPPHILRLFLWRVFLLSTREQIYIVRTGWFTTLVASMHVSEPPTSWQNKDIRHAVYDEAETSAFEKQHSDCPGFGVDRNCRLLFIYTRRSCHCGKTVTQYLYIANWWMALQVEQRSRVLSKILNSNTNILRQRFACCVGVPGTPYCERGSHDANL
jgi:hypothetical protein